MHHVDNQRSGLFLDGDARSLATLIVEGNQPVVLSGANSDSLTALASALDPGGGRVLEAEPGDASVVVRMETGAP